MLQWGQVADDTPGLASERKRGPGPPEPVGFRRPAPPLSDTAKAKALSDGIERLEQLLRDSLRARCTAQVSEGRILKSAFVKFDRDASGNVDIDEFCLALEHLGLHVDGLGAPGLGGVAREFAEGAFARLDSDGSGTIDYEEFVTQLMTNVTHRHF